MAFSKLTSKTSSKSVFSLLWEDIKKPVNIGFNLILFYKAISTIQVLGMILEIAMRFFENTQGKWDFINIPRTFTFASRFNFITSDAVTSFAFVSCMILILINYALLIGVFTVRKIKFEKLGDLSVVLQHYMVLYHFVFFLPIHTFMIEVIHYSSQNTIRLFGSTSYNLFYALGICGLVFNFGAGLLDVRCYSSLYAQKTYTKRNASLAFCDMIFVAFLSIYCTLVPTTVYAKWIIMCVTFAFIIINTYLFHSQLPFFQIKVLEVYCVCLGAKIAICFSVILTGIFDEFRTVPIPDLPLGAFILCFPICAYGQTYNMVRTLMNSITFEEKNYRNEDDVFIHILAIRYVFKKAARVSIKLSKIESSNWNMQLNGLVSRHNDACFNPSCGCRTFLELDEAAKSTGFRREKFKELEIIMMRDLYEKGVEKLPNSELILLNLAQFYLLYLENYLRSYLVLQAFEKKANKSFETEILIEYLKKRVQERMQLKLSGNDQQGLIGDYKPNNLNVTELVQNEVLFIQLKNLVQEQLIKQLRFWDLIDNFELNTYVIESCCDEIDYVRGKIDKLWENLSRINHKCSSHYLFFGLYQALVNNTTKRGERYLNDYSRLHGVNDQEKEGITNNNLYDTQTCVIKISMRRDKIGIVEDSSGDVDSLFGYQRSELIDANVATIMSNFFKERHHTFVMNHFELGTENVLNKAKRLFGYHKDGYIFPIFLYVSIYPNVETGLSYMGIIRPRKVYNNYILVKSDGSVDSYSPELAEYLGLESRKKYNISEICPDFEKINNAFNYFTRTKYENLKEDIVEYRQDSTNKKTSEYFVKVTGSESQSQKANETTFLAPNKKDMASLTSDMMEESNRIGSMETKDEGHSTIKAKNSDKERGGLRSVVKLKNAQKKVRRLNSEDIDEYKKVYEQFSINGSILTFLPQREKLESSVKNFLCTVSDEIFDYSILRIITLGRNDENMEVEKETERPKNNGKPTLPDLDNSRKPSNIEKDILLTTEQDDMGISSMPNFKEQQLFRNPFGTETPDNGSPAFGNGREGRTQEELQLFPNKQTLDVSDYQVQLQVSKLEMSDSRMDSRIDSKIKHTFTDKGSAKESNYTRDEHEDLGIDFYDSRDFIQEMLQTGQHDKNETSTSYISMKGGDISKFEALLYRREEGRTSNKLRSYFVIIGACFVMAILNTIITNTSLDDGSQKVQKLLSIGQRINTMLNMNYNSRMIYMYLNSYITDTRHLDDKQIANYPQYALDNLKTGAQTLLKLNTDVMNDIYDMHSTSQPKLFATMVQLEYPTANMREHNVDQLNVFEAIDTLALSALEVTSQPLATVSTQIEDIQYILLNSMNQLYLGLQGGYGIYEQDLEQALSGNRSATWGIGIGVVSLYVIFLFILLRDLTQNHQDKIRFWNSLTKLDILKGAGHKKMLLIMKENFETSSNFILLKKSLMEAKRQELKDLKATKAKEAQSTGFKKLKSYKLRNRNYFTVFPFIIVLAIIISFFVVTEVLVSEQMETKRLYMQEIIQSESYYELNLLTLNGLYEYISQKGTTSLEGQSIETALEDNLDDLSNLAMFVGNFETKSSFDPKMFMQISICDIYDNEQQKATCTADGQGINLQGLVSVLTFAKETMSTLMDFAKNSDKSDNSIKTALKQLNLLQLEIELPYISDMFSLLSSSLAESELSEQDSFRANQIIMLIAFILVLSLLSYFAVWKGFKKLEGRKFDNMKILRIIPTHMILDSKMLKTYLLKSFKDDLSSITNKL